MRRHQRGRRERGVAVVTALLLTTLAITIVASLFWQQQVQVRSIENQRLQLQKQWILRGALDWARLILREDAKFSSVDTLEEPWAVPLSETRLDQYVENGQADADAEDASLSGSIVDAQSRYNLSNMYVNGTINQAEVLVFERLLNNVEVNPALARATANAMAEATPKTEPGVARSDGPRPLPLEQLEDLLAVAGYTPAVLDKLREFVILLPRVTTINVNTAPAEVLSARIDTLSLGDAKALLTSRKSAHFLTPEDMINRLGGKVVSADDRKALNTSTNYFLVNGKVRMNRAGLEVQALVERNNATTRLIWIREN